MTPRTHALVGLTVSLVLTLAAAALKPVAEPASAQFQAEPAVEFVGISRADFEPHHRPQQQPLWCWASCAEMVLAQQGVDLPQHAIVSVVKGAGINAPGNPLEMIQATNHFIATRQGRTAVVSGQFIAGPPLPNVLYNHLKRGKPIVLAYQSGPWLGHAVVVHGMDVQVVQGPRGPYIDPLAFHVADPFCYRQAVDPFGNPHFALAPELRFRRYSWRPLPGAEPFPGQITGAILVEATLR